jgi:DDE family transposase
MFCHITQNWRGRPLVSHEVVVNLIGSTTTSKGLEIRAELDRETYPKGRKVSDAELAQGLRITIAKPASLGYFGFCVRWSVFQLPLRRLGMIVRGRKTLPCRSPVCALSGVAQATFLRSRGIFQAGKLCLALQVGSSPLRRAASSTANDTTPASVHSIP